MNALSAVLEECRRLEGMPFRHLGRLPESDGVDCAGLVMAAYSAAGHGLRDVARYSPRPSEDVLEAALRDSGFEVVYAGEDGDLLQLRIKSGGLLIARHLGILDGDGFWHVEHGRSVRRARLNDYWDSKLHQIWRFDEWRL